MVKIAKNGTRFIRKIGDTNSTFKMHELLADVGTMGKRLKTYWGDARPLIFLDDAEFTIVENQFSTQALAVAIKQDGIVRTYNVIIKNTNGGRLVVEGYDEGGELIDLNVWGSSSTTKGVPCLLTIITAYDKEYDQRLALVIKTDIE